MSFAAQYLAETRDILAAVDAAAVESLVRLLAGLRERGGRLFIVGSGGGAGHASHAACDFRKLAGIEAYAPADNVAELTARTNDEGWENSCSGWLRASRIGNRDMLLVFSVGGGDLERNISPNLVRALELAQAVGSAIGGIVGRDGGYTARVAAACVVIPQLDGSRVTPHTEGLQAVIWHLLISHPALQLAPAKWESQRP
jgi:D-sedoheptulose 7-phosphate isomerase